MDGDLGAARGPGPVDLVAAARPLTVSRLRLTPPRLPVARPTVVRLSWNGGAHAAADGGEPPATSSCPAPVRARALPADHPRRPVPARGDAARPARARGRHRLVERARPATGRVPAAGRCAPRAAACRSGSAAASVPLAAARARSPSWTPGRPLRAPGVRRRRCRWARAFQGSARCPAPFSVDLLRLRSPAPRPGVRPAGGGMVLDPGQLGPSSLTGVRVALAGPSWLVLGQSFSHGWRATCDGRSLGPPQPIDGYANGWPAPATAAASRSPSRPSRACAWPIWSRH